MTAGEVAGLVAAVAASLAAVGLLIALGSLTRTLKELRLTVQDFRAQALPLVTQLRATAAKADDELERVDQLLGSGESILSTVDSASHLAYLFLANPVVKVLAAGSGTARALRRVRRRRA